MMETKNAKHIDIVFDGPSRHEPGCFVEVENELGQSIKFGQWVKRVDGYWVLRFPVPEAVNQKLIDDLVGALKELANEAAGFVSMADPANHGHTNITILKLRIDDARAAIKLAKEK